MGIQCYGVPHDLRSFSRGWLVLVVLSGCLSLLLLGFSGGGGSEASAGHHL